MATITMEMKRGALNFLRQQVFEEKKLKNS